MPQAIQSITVEMLILTQVVDLFHQAADDASIESLVDRLRPVFAKIAPSLEEQYYDGLITADEAMRKLIDTMADEAQKSIDANRG